MGNGMNKVLPGLYVGNFRDSKDPEQLKTHNITHILSIHDNARKLPCNSDKEYMCIVASDSPGQNLTQYFPACNDFIHTARLKGGGVLIHCLAGMSRSVTVAVVYVMCVTSLSWRDSLKAVRGARNVANPNVGFLKQIQDFENDRLSEERRRLRAKYHNVTLEDEDEQMAKQLLASYYHSMSIGEMCEGNCPPGVACPRGLCHPPRRVGLFRRNSRDSTGSRSSSPSRHRSSSPSRGPNSPGSSPVSPRRSSPTPPSPLIRRSSHSRSSSPQLSPPQSMSPSTNRRSSSPLTSPRHGSAPTSPNHSISPVRSMSSSPLNSPIYGSPLSSPKNSFVPTFGTRHSYTSPPGTPNRSTSPVGFGKRSTSPSSPKKVSSCPNSPQHSGSSYSPKNIFRKCSLWNYSKNSSQKSSKSNSDSQDIDNDTDSLKNKKEESSRRAVKQEITKQTSLPLQRTEQLSPNQHIYRQNSLPQQHSQSQLTPQYQPSGYGSYLHIYRQASLPEEEHEESLQIYVSPFSSPQHQRYRWVTCHVPANNQHLQQSELPPCPYNELFKQASLQEPRQKSTPSPQNNANDPISEVDNINSANDSCTNERKISKQSSLDHDISTVKKPSKHLTRQASLPEGALNANTYSPQRRPPPPPIPENAKVSHKKHPLEKQNSFSGKGANNNTEIPPVLHVPILPRVPPPLPPNKPQYVPNSSQSTQSKTSLKADHLESNAKSNLMAESPAKTHQTTLQKIEQMSDIQTRMDKRNETEMSQNNSNESPVKKVAKVNQSYVNENTQNNSGKESSSHKAISRQHSKSDISVKQEKPEIIKQCNSPSGSPIKKQTKPDSPKKQARQPESPSKLGKHPESPIKPEKKLDSPLVQRTPPGSPIRRQTRSDSPLKQDGRPDSPLKNDSPVGSPTRRQNKFESRPESPLKKHSSGSPVKKKNSLETIDRQEKESGPIPKKDKQTEPICTCGGKVYQSSKGQPSLIKQISRSNLQIQSDIVESAKKNIVETSDERDKKSELMSRKENQTELPINKEPICTCDGKVNQASKEQASLTKQISKSNLHTQSETVESAKKIASHNSQQQVPASLQSVTSTKVLPQTKGSQSPLQKPTCPPRKAIPSSTNSPEFKESASKHEQVVLPKEPQNKPSKGSQKPILKGITEQKCSSQKDSTPPSLPKQKNAIPAIERREQNIAVKSQSIISTASNLKQQPNSQSQSEHNRKPLQEVEQHLKQNQHQHQGHNKKKDEMRGAKNLEGKQGNLPHPQNSSENLSAAPQTVPHASPSSESKQCSCKPEIKVSGSVPAISKPRSQTPQVPPRQGAMLTAPRKPTPIQQQPRPTPPLPPSPKPTVAMLSQSQNPRSCTPCLPIQPCPNPAAATQVNGSATVVIAKTAVQQPSTSVPPTVTKNSHPHPLSNQRPSSHSSALPPNIPTVKANSSTDSCQSKESVVAPKSTSVTSCSTVKGQSNKHTDSNDSIKVKQVNKVSTDKQKTSGNAKSLAKDAPLTPHKPTTQSKPQETVTKATGHEIFKTCTLKNSPKTCPSPVPPLPSSPRPSINSKQSLNSPKNAKGSLAQ